jgi:hypothetical protein
MPYIQGVMGEAVVVYRKPITTKEMRYYRLSQRVNNTANLMPFDLYEEKLKRNIVKSTKIAKPLYNKI